MWGLKLARGNYQTILTHQEDGPGSSQNPTQCSIRSSNVGARGNGLPEGPMEQMPLGGPQISHLG